MPLTVGGGVRSVEDIRRLLQVGADKIAINTAAVEQPELIRLAAEQFGSQCVVVSIDIRQSTTTGNYEVFTHAGSHATGKDPVIWAKEVESMGAGEILLTSIDRDGKMDGYDIKLIQEVSHEVSIPVIASGGAGCYQHMVEALTTGGASAVAAASIFHFTQQTPLEAKYFLKHKGLNVRL